MRKLIFVLFLIPSVSFCETITVTHSDGRSAIIDDSEIKIVENDVIDAFEWLEGAWNGKVSSCESRIIDQEVIKSIENGEQIPILKEDIVQKYFDRPGYKNRKDKEKEK
ncbi:MAG TPA: hypothetical protein VMW34_06470 [Anaerolineales bacterium]|nr:hypothetical protein [Anaerolineales bacterium]